MFHFRKNYFGTRDKIQMRDLPVFSKVFSACITVKIKMYWYLGAVIFSEVKFLNFQLQVSHEKNL